jgi:DNA-binding SARP family transcriptional activator/Tfp pilus assembly protein PilF
VSSDRRRVAAVEFRLLGPLEVYENGVPLSMGGRRQRAVLAALLLRANDTATVGYLASAVWETPPVAPESNIRTYVAGLRQRLSGGSSRLRTAPGGYQLEVQPGELDMDTFSQLAERGSRALRQGDFTTAAAQLVRALSLWNGPPLAELTPGPVLQAEMARLEDLRLAVVEQHAQACIELGRPETAVEQLRALLTEYPLREELWAQLMLALAQCGRRAEALDVFTRARRHLVSELGIEPGDQLRQVHQRLLADEPEPDTSEVTALRQLPMDIAEFTGRVPELHRLHSLLRDSVVQSAVAVVTIDGMAGVGKTRLAVHAAHQLVEAGQFDEIQLWTDLRGFDPEHSPTDPATVLESFLRMLGVPGDQIPHGLDDRAALYRDRLAGRKALILLDNAVGEEQIRPLLPGVAGSLVMITSRRRLTELDGAYPLSLDVLSNGEAIDLLHRVTGDERIVAAPEDAAQVAQLCGRLPIALALAARRLRSRPMWTTRELAVRMASSPDRLAQLSPQRQGVRTMFGLSYQALPLQRRRMFRLLGLHPGKDFTAGSAAALLGTTPELAELVLETLLDEHLLHETTIGRYEFHDLLRSYARGRAEAEDSVLERQTAVRRLVVWYAHAAEAARKVVDPHRVRRLRLPPLPDTCELPEFRDYEHALAWLEAERAGLIAVVDAAADSGLLDVAWQLPWILLSYFYRRSLWDDWITCYRKGLAAAQAADDRFGEATMYTGLGVAHSDLRQYTTAIDYHDAALAIFENLDDPHGMAWNLNNLGVIYVELQRFDQAADCFQRALPMFRDTGETQGEAICLNNLGDTNRHLGRPDIAIEHLERALTVQRRAGDEAGLQYTLHSLGDAHHDTGQHEPAVRYYQEAIVTSRALGDQRKLARSLSQLARTLDTLGNANAARLHRQQAVAIFETLGDDEQAGTLRELMNGHDARTD